MSQEKHLDFRLSCGGKTHCKEAETQYLFHISTSLIHFIRLFAYNHKTAVGHDFDRNGSRIFQLELLCFERLALLVGINHGFRALQTERRKVKFDFHRLLEGIDTGDIPLVGMPAGKNDIFAGITVDKPGIVPCSRDGFHKRNRVGGSIGEIVGSKGEILHRF